MRKAHIIKDNKRAETPANFIFFDTETPDKKTGKFVEEGKHELYVGIACYVRRREKERNRKINEDWITFTTPAEFWDFVVKHHYAKTTLYIFAHNTRYDLPVVEGYRYLNIHGYKIIFDTFDSNPCIIKARKEGVGSIVILDTFNYFKTSIEKLGETFNIPKLNPPLGNPDREAWAKYCKRDVEVCKTAMLTFIDTIEKEDWGGFGFTIAKQAFNAYRHKFMFHDIHVHALPDITEIERKAYKGGRAEAFYIGDINAIGYDINSAYPNVMRKERYPTRYHHIEYNITEKKLKSLMTKYLVIADISFSINKPAIGVRRKELKLESGEIKKLKAEKLIFPIGNIRETITTPEIKLIWKYGKIEKIHSVVCYEHAPIFKKYVDYFYTKRLNAKKQNDAVMTLFYKYMLNSLYGKFGQRSDKWIEKGVTDDEDSGLNEIVYDDGNSVLQYIINGFIWEKAGKEEGYDTFIAISAFVTAYQRCELWKWIEKIPEDMLYYVDTDSLWIAPEAEKYLKRYKHPTKLGALKREDKQIAKIQGVKMYIDNAGIKHFKGIRPDAKEIERGIFEQLKFIGFKTALRRGDPNMMIVEKVRKDINNPYDKGIITKKGRVKPYKLKEW